MTFTIPQIQNFLFSLNIIIIFRLLLTHSRLWNEDKRQMNKPGGLDVETNRDRDRERP